MGALITRGVDAIDTLRPQRRALATLSKSLVAVDDAQATLDSCNCMGWMNPRDARHLQLATEQGANSPSLPALAAKRDALVALIAAPPLSDLMHAQAFVHLLAQIYRKKLGHDIMATKMTAQKASTAQFE